MGIFLSICGAIKKNKGIIPDVPPPVPIGDTVEVSKHIRGHIASFSESSDWTGTAHDRGGELLCLKHNIAGTMFFKEQGAISDRFAKLGRVDLGIYDEAGLTGLAGLNTSRGRPITSLAYSGGTDDNKLTYLDDVLSGRNSLYETNPLSIEYSGLTDVDLISKASTIRWEYYTELLGRPDFIAGTTQEGIDKVNLYVDQTIQSAGHYHNFMHWHWWEKDYPDIYFNTLSNALSGQDIYSGSYSDIQEYQFVRDSVDSISLSGNTVSVNYSKKYPNSPYNKITVPLWVKVNLSETTLAGKDISVSHGGKIRKISTDVFAIAIGLDFEQTSVSFTISESLSPAYVNLNMPVVALNGQTFTSDQPVKMNLYRKLKTAYIKDASTVGLYHDTFQNQITIAQTFDTVNYNYYIGFINQEGVSGTLEF